MGALGYAKKALTSVMMLLGFFVTMVIIGIAVYLVTGTRKVGGLGLWAILYSLILAKKVGVELRVGSASLAFIALGLGFVVPFSFVGWSLTDPLKVVGITLGALGEELLFRGLIQGYLGDDLRAIILASALFSSSHALQNPSPLYLLNIFIAGIALGLWKVMGKGLLAPTALHAGWNLALIHLGSFEEFEGSFEGLLASLIILVLTLALKVTFSRGPLCLRGSSPSS